MKSVTVLLFIKAIASSPVEHWVAQAQVAAALDTLEKLRALKTIGEIIVATPSAEFAEQVRRLGVRVETDATDDDFHWGKVLVRLIQKYRITHPLYIGGGSGVLMTRQDWESLCERILIEDNLVVTNNFFSSDFAAWTPGDAVMRFEPPPVDNDLAYRLGERAHLTVSPLDKNATTQFDIDTPTDLLAIALHPGIGATLRTFLNAVPLDSSRLEKIRALFRDNQKTLFIAGRVSATMMQFLERTTRCQWRIVSEERGMRASGRDERGEVRSLLGLHIDQIGARRFVDEIAQLGNAALIDSRVLFAHRRLRPTPADRFYSDLLEPDRIADAWIREFTRAARDAQIPIVLGGHSLVAGGIYVLAESTR